MKLIELEMNNYDDFVRNHPYKSHFLQSAAWGILAKEKRNLTPYYLGLVDDKGQIHAATLLLQKHLPLKLCYLYAPRGYVIDFENQKLLEEFTKEIVTFAKKKNAIYIKIDPDIIWQKETCNKEIIEIEKKEQKVYKNLQKLGYHHLGFTKNFETMQPRYTFRIDLTQDIETIKSHFSKTTKQRINKSLKLKTKVEIGKEKDLEEFYHLMMLTEDRKDFVSYPLDYYQTLYRLFNKKNKATLFLGKANLTDILKITEEEEKDCIEKLNTIPQENLSKSAKNKQKELQKQLEKIRKDKKNYQAIKEQYGKEITLSAHMIIEYGNKAWVLYAGNHNILTDTYTNYHTYQKHLEFCKNRKLKIYDQFGTIGDLSSENPRLGLHEFKKKWGGDYIEFIGEFDYIIKPFFYFIFQKLVPLYRNMIKKKKKKELKNEVQRVK